MMTCVTMKWVNLIWQKHHHPQLGWSWFPHQTIQAHNDFLFKTNNRDTKIYKHRIQMLQIIATNSRKHGSLLVNKKYFHTWNSSKMTFFCKNFTHLDQKQTSTDTLNGQFSFSKISFVTKQCPWNNMQKQKIFSSFSDIKIKVPTKKRKEKSWPFSSKVLLKKLQTNYY